VGFYLDEIPLSPPAVSQSGKVVIDPNVYDIERVEVLRGPQGTLYGSGSMGGTVKVITNQPKLGLFEGSVQGTGSYTEGGSGNGGGNLMLNFPLGDQFAVRIVLSDQYRSGWLDNITVQPFPVNLNSPVQGDVLAAPVTNIIRKANTETLYSGRIGLLYKPSEDLSILATAMTQGLHLGGYDLLDGSPNSAAPSRVYNAHYEAFPLRDGIRRRYLHLRPDRERQLRLRRPDECELLLGPSRIPSRGCLGIHLLFESEQRGRQRQPAVRRGNAVRAGSVRGTRSVAPTQSGKSGLTVARRRRLALGGGRLLQLPAFGVERNRPQSAQRDAAVPDGAYFISGNDYGVRQTALFADGSYKFNDQWKLAAGVRYYDYKSHQDEYSWGYDGPNSTPPANSKITTAKNSGANPRVNLSYTPNPDLTLYTTVSKGFPSRRCQPDPAAVESAAVLSGGRPIVRSGRRVETMRSVKRPGSSTTGSRSTATSTTSSGPVFSRC